MTSVAARFGIFSAPMIRRRIAPILFVLLVASARAASAAGADTPRELQARRASRPIVLDGALDERDWAEAPAATNFTQSDPHEGEPASERTDVRVLYDADRLYIGVFVHDDHPIVVNALSKDFDTSNADIFEVVLDTLRRSAQRVSVRRQRDGREMGRADGERRAGRQRNWDGIWHVRTRIGEERLVRGDRDPVPDAAVHERRPADLGHQFPAPHPAPERRRLLVADPPHLPDHPHVARRARCRACRASVRAATSGSSRTS